MNTDDARADLAAWLAEYPEDPFAADDALRGVLARALPADRLAELERDAGAFARDVTGVVAPAAARYEHRSHLPELARWDGIGRRTEAVQFDEAYHRAGRAVWRSGLVARSDRPGSAYEQAVLLYLLSLEGEAGHACPAVCTIGLARALRRVGEDAVRERFLPALVDLDYDAADRGSQFLTEVQGGGDVGANATIAEPQGDGSFRVTGEKWFCSVADADQFLVTARVPGQGDGTRGLGTFVIPRLVDGRPNGFSLRRLKDKLGTRGLASGEIDFDGAIAWPIGPLTDGFRTAVGIVLNTSRWMTAVGSVGMMRRAELEARAYARHRRAFSRTIDAYPMTRATLARLRTRRLGGLHLVFALTGLEDRIDLGTADAEDLAEHRFWVNVAKYTLSLDGTAAVHDAIEVLGGNGAIEEFSVLPRLYRDAIVYESWEGSHNVLIAQLLADCRRLPLLDVVEARMAAIVDSLDGELARVLGGALVEVAGRLRAAVADPDLGSWQLRSLVDRTASIARAVHLAAAGEQLAARHEVAERVLCLAPHDDPGYSSRIDALVAD